MFGVLLVWLCIGWKYNKINTSADFFIQTISCIVIELCICNIFIRVIVTLLDNHWVVSHFQLLSGLFFYSRVYGIRIYIRKRIKIFSALYKDEYKQEEY